MLLELERDHTKGFVPVAMAAFKINFNFTCKMNKKIDKKRQNEKKDERSILQKIADFIMELIVG